MIETARLTLRPFEPRHLLALVDGDPDFESRFGARLADGLGAYFRSADVSPQWVAMLRESRDYDPWQHGFAVVEREARQIVGTVAFKGAPDADGAVEIAYGVAPGFQGRGLAKEATEAGVAFAFADPAVRVVRAHTISANAASIGVLRRCRFHFVGDVVDPDDGLVLRWERFRPSSRAPERVVTPRLVLVPPAAADAKTIFTRYASDSDVTRYLSWPTHRAVSDTEQFVAFAASEWAQKPAGPYLIRDRETGQLLGGTGLATDAPGYAMTGYVIARTAWGAGLATEALRAMVGVARAIGMRGLAAICHEDHAASIRVLEKAGFARDATPMLPIIFPNLDADAPQPVLRYSRGLD